jgi:hypothetical protein
VTGPANATKRGMKRGIGEERKKKKVWMTAPACEPMNFAAALDVPLSQARRGGQASFRTPAFIGAVGIRRSRSHVCEGPYVR